VKKNSTKQWGVFFLLVCAIPFILRRPLGDAVFWHLGAGRSLLYHSFGPGLWADWMMPAYFYCTWASDLVLEIISMIVGIRHLWCLVPILVVSLTTWLFGQTKSVFCSVLFICLTFPFYEVGPTLFAVAYSTFFCVCLSLQQPERRIGNLLLIVALWANFHPSFIAGCLSLILLWVYPQSATKKLNWPSISQPWVALAPWLILLCFWPWLMIPLALTILPSAWTYITQRISSLRATSLYDHGVGCFIFAILCVISLQTGNARMPWKYDIAPEQHPLDAAKFYANLAYPARVLYDPSLGPYLFWASKNPSFWEAHSRAETLATEMRRIRKKTSLAMDTLRHANIGLCILDHRIPGSEALLHWLQEQNEWHLVYCDAIAVIFIQARPEPRVLEIVNQYRITDDAENPKLDVSTSTPPIQACIQRSRAYLSLQMPQRTQADLSQIAQYPAYNDIACLIQGKISLLQGDFQTAITHFQESWKHNPHSVETLAFWIEALLRGNTQDYFQQAVGLISLAPQALDPKAEATILFWFQASQAYYLIGQKRTAKTFLEKIQAIDPMHEASEAFLTQINKELRKENIQQDIERSKSLIQQKKYMEALDLLKSIIDADPKAIEAYLEIGKIEMQQQNFAQAAQIFREILAMSPNHLLAQCKLAIALAALGEWQTSLKILEPLEKANPDRYEIREALFIADQAAIEQLIAQLSRHFSYPQLIQLTDILTRREQFQTAIDVWEKCQRYIFVPGNSDAPIRLAKLYFEQGKYYLNQKNVTLALQLLQHSLKLDPDFFDCHLLLATLALKLKDWPAATQHFQAMRRIAPLDIRASEGLALVELGQGLHLQLTGQYQEAVSKFAEYLKQAPQSEDKDSISQWIQNLQRMNQILTQQEQRKSLFQEAAQAMQSQDWQKAIELWTKVLEYDPNLAQARFNRSQCHSHLNQWDLAKQDLLQTIALQPDFPEAHLNLGHAYYLEGNAALAKQHLQKYLDLAPHGEHAATIRGVLQSLEK